MIQHEHSEIYRNKNYVRVPHPNFFRKSEKQKIEMKKENKYDTTRTVGNLQK